MEEPLKFLIFSGAERFWPFFRRMHHQCKSNGRPRLRFYRRRYALRPRYPSVLWQLETLFVNFREHFRLVMQLYIYHTYSTKFRTKYISLRFFA
jgi:hypothetical protein